jgi:hemerythrin
MFLFLNSLLLALVAMSDFIRWTKRLSVGIDEIDAQHRRFIGMINKTYGLASAEKLRPLLKGSISELLEYADLHFATEERYFAKYDYPFAREHIMQHNLQRGRAVKLAKMVDDGEDVAIEFMDYLKDWLEDHLKRQDMKYAKYFAKIGAVKKGKFGPVPKRLDFTKVV